ncbi:MAG TPA: putative sulfate exporter family transporter, partial [Candidatus Methylacidiphilales bacterium]
MTLHCPRFRAGLGLTVLLAVGGLVLGTLPGLARLGPLSVALLLGLLWRAAAEVPEGHHAGIGFAAKRLLRWGIVLLGVRLDFALIARSGWRIAVLDVAVIAFGVAFITWLGRRAGIAGRLPLLLAVGSSICGASAVAAAAPVVRARESEIALAIPLCGVLGTAAALGLTGAEAWLHLAPQTYGILAGSTLHEVAQVIAASAAVPGALESGTVAKLLRVLLLVPVVLLLARLLDGRGKGREAAPVPQPWFVGGFLLVGVANTALVHG